MKLLELNEPNDLRGPFAGAILFFVLFFYSSIHKHYVILKCWHVSMMASAEVEMN